MGIQDVLITPFYLFLFSVIAYWLRPYFTDTKTRKYFMSALYVRFFGAVALGSLIFSFVFWGFGFLRMGTTGLTAQAEGAIDLYFEPEDGALTTPVFSNLSYGDEAGSAD